VTDRVTVTVFYHDALTEARGNTQRRAMLVEASRDVPMILAACWASSTKASRPPALSRAS